ncbi:F-box/LRR-repeat protein 6 [Frankliniella fusca]|uniref:F-box/LRR-repeat protein 6 n=1 Tax=Frankliniella fusca TaxID=407009 RepID=A0AAE1LRE4_9NEOP|nr:F-box/LRR-repeat protein 6 [Frankliniella fusca]
MDDLNGDYHEDFFMKEFLIEPSKPNRNMYGNNLLHQQSQQQRPQQQMQPGMMYGANPGICGVSNSTSYPNSNCYESNGGLDSMSMHNASSVGTSLVAPHYLPNMSSHLAGMQQMSSSSVNLPGSSSRIAMPNNNMSMSSNSMGIPVPNQSGLGMGLTGNGSSSNRIPYNSSTNQYAGPSTGVMGLHPSGSMHGSTSSNVPLHSQSNNGMGLHSNPSPGGMGMHSSSSSSNLGMHSVPSPGGMGMHSSPSPAGLSLHSNAGLHSAPASGLGLHSSPSPAMHPSASPSNRGMLSSASPSGMGMHSSASPSGMGMHSNASSSSMGIHSSASPSGMGIHSSASPSGMGIRSNPSPAMHSSASPGGMGMHSSASPAGMGMHSGMPSPASSMGKPSGSPSRSAPPVPSPNVMNLQSGPVRSPMGASASRSPFQSSPSHFSNASPANIPSASPGHLSRHCTSPGRMNMMTTSPMGTQDMNGASYSASCSEGSSPAALERLAAERLPSGVTVSVADRGEALGQLRRTPPPQDVLTITPVQDMYAGAGTSGAKKKKDMTQVKKVRRKADESGGKAKKRKAIRAQLISNDPRGETGFGAPSLYDLLTDDNPCNQSLLSVGGIPSGTANYDITTAQGTVKRGRKRKTGDGTPKAPPKPRTTVTYQSQISSQNGIKLRIKKSEPVKKPPKQRVRKKKNKSALDSDSDEGGHHKRVNHKQAADPSDEGKEQSCWGSDELPKKVLHKIFKYVSYDEGCVPFLVRMQRVCRHWREVATTPDLWHTIELCSTWVRDRAKNHHTFRWLCENRLTRVRELNLGGWKFSGIPALLDVIANNCVELRGLNLTGWQGLHIEHIMFLVTNCQNLQKLDLSGVNPEAHNNKGAVVSLSSMQHLTSVMGDRLTHLVLANNKLAGVPQIVMAIAGACPNLEVLDMSNIRTVSHATAHIHLENLQKGCSKLRVFRITNSQFALAPVSIKEQVESPGFPNLEELSVACPNGRMDSLVTSQPSIDDDAIGRILKTSNKLRLLDVRGCSKITGSSLVRIPAWDLEHLFLSGCYATRISDSGLELITQKWGHSLVELDLAWSSATESLDLAVSALAEVPEKGNTSPLRILNLCGSSVSLDPVKAVLINCLNLFSLNLASCRGLPRGMKRHYEGIELVELRSQYEDKPRKSKVEEEEDPKPAEAQDDKQLATNHCVAGSSSQMNAENEIKSEHEPDSDADVNLHEESEDEADQDAEEHGSDFGLESDLEQDADRERDSQVKAEEAEQEEHELGAYAGDGENAPQSKSDPDNYSQSSSAVGNPYEELDRPKTESLLLQSPPQSGMDDMVMTPEDLQMVAEALANTPDADRIAAAAEAEAGMTPTGRSTPLGTSAASSTPRSGSGTYSEAGTPGPSGTPGTLSETGTEAGTPGTPGTTVTSGTTPQQGADGDGELLALAQDVKYSLDNHLNFSFSELDCGPSLQ